MNSVRFVLQWFQPEQWKICQDHEGHNEKIQFFFVIFHCMQKWSDIENVVFIPVNKLSMFLPVFKDGFEQLDKGFMCGTFKGII